MKQEIVIIANGAPYGSESLFNALRLAIALREQGGANLKLFLMSDAVSAALAGQARSLAQGGRTAPHDLPPPSKGLTQSRVTCPARAWPAPC